MNGWFANSRGMAFASLLIPFATACCSAPERQEIPGRYEYPNDAGKTETLVLRANGSGEVNGLSGYPPTVPLNWNVNDDYDQNGCTRMDFYSIEPQRLEWHTCAEGIPNGVVIGHPLKEDTFFRKIKR